MNLLELSPFQRFLEKVTARSVLSDAERCAIMNLPGRPIQVETNRDFVRLGERVDHACLVVEGLVGRFGQNREGGRQITGLYISGDMVDLHSVVVPEATSALQALAVTTIIQVPHSALRDVVRRYPALAEAFWRECVVDAAILGEWTVNVGRRDARSRTAHLLCEMAYRYGCGPAARGSTFRFPATQAHLADILALTSVHVNRTLKALKEDDVVALRTREVTVLDWDKMADIGDFHPGYLQIRKPAATDQVILNRG